MPRVSVAWGQVICRVSSTGVPVVQGSQRSMLWAAQSAGCYHTRNPQDTRNPQEIPSKSPKYCTQVRWQNTAGAEGLSILGGAFVPEEKRRRCCGVVLCAAAGVLLLCVAALTGIFFIKVRAVCIIPSVLPEPLFKAHRDAASAPFPGPCQRRCICYPGDGVGLI